MKHLARSVKVAYQDLEGAKKSRLKGLLIKKLPRLTKIISHQTCVA